ncbi:hypothetical protein [Stagnihabitans tardus]|uniref:Uncharacterized protein n=1 Tax=Stagnihabitans tardus TaxID=2699202 RepID=A0AAE4YC57_9RHOB|nr:hypothetical protein [Stagnihabitans tardus]NBZ88691.1 hypothetical protein [Stagnihabitans tardus]
MSKILFMGSSHLGAVKLGYEQIAAEFPGAEVDFFGAPAKVFAAMALTEDLQFGITATSQVTEVEAQRVERTFGRREVDLRAYDTVVILGHRIEEIVNAQVLNSHSVAGLSEAPDLPPLTQETYLALMDSYLTGLLPDPAWAAIIRPRVIFVAKPRMSEGCVKGTSPRTKPWAELIRRGLVKGPGLQLFLDRARAVFADKGLHLITPPPEVLGATGLTRADFSRAGAPDAGDALAGNDFDYSHMNAAYGVIMARSIMETVAG